jgi:hypothetical protein
MVYIKKMKRVAKFFTGSKKSRRSVNMITLENDHVNRYRQGDKVLGHFLRIETNFNEQCRWFRRNPPDSLFFLGWRGVVCVHLRKKKATVVRSPFPVISVWTFSTLCFSSSKVQPWGYSSLSVPGQTTCNRNYTCVVPEPRAFYKSYRHNDILWHTNLFS